MKEILLFVLGAALVQGLPELPGLPIAAVLAAGLAACLWFRCTLGAAFLCGLLWALGYAAVRLEERLPGDGRMPEVVAEGEILDIPRTMERGLRFDFAVERWLQPDGLALPRHLRLTWYDPPIAPKAGERWRFHLRLRSPHGMLNPGGMDYEQWLFTQGIRAVGYVRTAPGNDRIGLAANGWSPRVWRQSLHDRLADLLAGSPVAGLVQALVMGVDDGITPAQWEVLRRTGTTHLIAISGSHIGLIAALVFFLVRWLCAWLGLLFWPPPRIAAVCGFSVAWLYSALAGFSIPTQRAMIMVGITMGAVAWQRNPNPSHILATALLAVVLYDPLALLAPGFWLSFGAVALIGYGLAGRIGSRRAWQVLAQTNWVTAVGLAPMLLWSFRQVSLISPFANLVAVPVLGTLLIPVCLGGALLLPVFPEAGKPLLLLAEWLLRTFWPLLEWLSAVSWAQWLHAEVPLWTIPPACLGTLLLLAPRGIPARWLGLVLLLPAAAHQPERPSPGGFRLALLDVGQGLATVLETRRHVMVFDTGARFSSQFDMGSAVIGPYLQSRGIRRIDTLVISHGDNDHIGGAGSLLQNFPVGRILASVPDELRNFPVGGNHASVPDELQNFPVGGSHAGTPTLPCRAGEGWVWDGVVFRMLGPLRDMERENDDSCVLQVRGRTASILMTGDIERAGEGALVERYGTGLASDVLIVPHHGSKTSSTARFLDSVRPRLALIPAGRLNRFGFPHGEVLRRYAERKVEVLVTADSGAIGLLAGSGTEGMRRERYRLEHRRYWNER